MPSTPICGLPNAFAVGTVAQLPPLVDLSKQFCACPAALDAFRDIQGTFPVHLVETNKPAAYINDVYESGEGYRKSMSKIYIPKTQLAKAKGVYQLTFELFNAHNSNTKTPYLDKAEKGDIGMDEFATFSENLESETQKSMEKLFKACAPKWKSLKLDIKPFLDAHSATTQLGLTNEDQLWYQELECHTDKVRERWIETFQKPYCAKHPEDKKSCETKKEDLCDYDAHLRRAPEDRMHFTRMRACKIFHQASKKMQALFSSVIESVCPEVVKKHTSERNEL